MKVEELYTKMQEYLGMDTEIPFQEFSEYYRKVLNYLNSNYEQMSREEKSRVNLWWRSLRVTVSLAPGEKGRK